MVIPRRRFTWLNQRKTSISKKEISTTYGCILQQKETPNRLSCGRINQSSLSRNDGCPGGVKEVIPASSERGTPAPPKEASIPFRYSRIISRCRSMPTRNHPSICEWIEYRCEWEKGLAYQIKKTFPSHPTACFYFPLVRAGKECHFLVDSYEG